MNWKNEAIERLRSYPSAALAMKNLKAEISRVESLLASPGTVRMDAPIHSAKSREEWTLDNLVLLQLLRDRLRQLEDWKKTTDRALEVLPPEELQIIRQLYFEKQRDMERVSQENNATKSTLYRYRDRALEKFALALYGPVS